MEKNKLKNIAITTDRNYTIYAAVMLHSFFLNNKPSDYVIHIIVDFRNHFYKIPLLYILRKHQANFKFYFISEKDIHYSEDLIITDHISIATYFRLFLSSILNDVNKALFLDCDMIVDGNVEELYAIDINDYSLAAVTDNIESRIHALGLNHNYFNAGVMLLNLSYFREHQLESKFSSFIKNHSDKIQFWDQDVLNATTGNERLEINNKWNCLTQNYTDKNTPAIIHYAGYHKPWNGFCEHPLSDRYFYYLHSDRILMILHTFYRSYFKLYKFLVNLFSN